MEKQKVLIAVPNDNGWVHKLVTFACIKMLSDGRVKSNLIMPTHKPIENNRNLIIRDFLKDGYDFLIMIDADNPPMNNILDLVYYDLDVIGCPTIVWHSAKKGDRPYYLNALKSVGEEGYIPIGPNGKNSLIEVDAIGSGCMVIARRVLEKLQFKKPFERTWNNEGIVIKGSDYFFCDKVKQEGFKIYAHFGYLCRHFNELDLNEVVESMMEFRINGTN